MNNKTILQVPIDISLRDQALRAAESLGFSSLQETIRVFLRKLANKSITISFEETENLSPSAEKRYAKMIRDYKENKNIIHCESVDDLFKKLNED
ncbi:hypothetical protein CO169_01720 [Candidatus Shapirobacteria bacterium CG_4_9_14_3_um_filter_39_13]|uniref:Type II toxin-antitoxin system antitoxin, RelB/DinJ family n=1 Tax=Candidatus Shapirobacteria bacterium CG_4_9_14_3_um_filter_39_13 TaxID=1974479 RepID=A0A2M7XLH3_9BACT|nr:MAG: hypothetical protein CO169_01720 [Candidatus Shapirobacteria bacterium CG_4_9_14_3_um_filter_39_13]